MNRMLTDEEKAFIREYVAAAVSDEEKRARRIECAHDFGVSLPVIGAITAWTKIYADKARRTLATHISEDAQTGQTNASINASPEIIIQKQEPQGGEHVNYDNEIKQKWREKWKEYLIRQTTADERKVMRVLCLPGKACLEVPLYLELGFSAKNIVGVEGGDSDARREFSENAARFGIDARLGRLEKIVKEESMPFDVVSLDFLGQMAPAYMHIVQNILVNRRAIMLTNFMAKREKRNIQEVFNVANSMIAIDHKKFGEHGPDLLDHLEEKAREEYRNGDIELAHVRSSASALNYFSMIGIQRMENWLHKNKIINFPLPTLKSESHENMAQGEKINLIKASIELATRTVLKPLQHLLTHHGFREHDAGRAVFMAQALTQHAAYGATFTMDLESSRYISQSGKTGSPFESDFAVLKKPTNLYEQSRRTSAFVLEAARHAMISAITTTDPPKLYLRDKHGRLPEYAKPIKNSDSIILESASGEHISRLDVRRFFNDLKIYMSAFEGNIVDRIGRGEVTVERKLIQ